MRYRSIWAKISIVVCLLATIACAGNPTTKKNLTEDESIHDLIRTLENEYGEKETSFGEGDPLIATKAVPKHLLIYPEYRPSELSPDSRRAKSQSKWVEGKPSRIVLARGESIQLGTQIVDKEGKKTDGFFNIKWSVNTHPEANVSKWSRWNVNVATVTKDGLVVASKDVGGYAMITASIPDLRIENSVEIWTKVPIHKVFGSVIALDIAQNRKFVENRNFSGHAFLMFDSSGETEAIKLSEEIASDYENTAQFYGWGDRYALSAAGMCALDTHGLVLGGKLFLGSDNAEYGIFQQLPCHDTPRYYAILSHYSVFDRDGSEVKCKSGTCSYEYDKKKRRYRFRFGKSMVQVTPVKELCMDTTVHDVVVKDRRGGRLRLKDIYNFSIIEHDADGNGEKELYILSTVACSRSIKVYKVVFK
ncbi:MAG: hypothetical protein QNJ97_25255 [Myxococcota bacterium]|nr:hypothetical protein [Myxococcota bacterium]